MADIARGTVPGRMFPRMAAAFQGPELLVNSARMRAAHNRAAKRAGKAVMQLHWLKRLPKHFKANNRLDYDHKERKRSTKARKRREHGSITDLVKTGRTRDSMTSFTPRIRLGGSAVNKGGDGLMVVTMELRFPFPVRFDDDPNRVTVRDMAQEIARWTPSDVLEAAKEYEEIFAEEFNIELQSSPRIRKRLGREQCPNALDYTRAPTFTRVAR